MLAQLRARQNQPIHPPLPSITMDARDAPTTHVTHRRLRHNRQQLHEEPSAVLQCSVLAFPVSILAALATVHRKLLTNLTQRHILCSSDVTLPRIFYNKQDAPKPRHLRPAFRREASDSDWFTVVLRQPANNNPASNTIPRDLRSGGLPLYTLPRRPSP